MKITFAGVGGAFTDQRYYQSNMVVEGESGKRLLIDCGGDARFSLGELGVTPANIGEWLDAVYISHLHADHIGGLEFVGFCSYFNVNADPPKLFIADELIADLWDSLKAGMRSHEHKTLDLYSYFDVEPFDAPYGNFQWDGLDIHTFETLHIDSAFHKMYSYGLVINYKNHSVMITTDTQYNVALGSLYKPATLIFHDCETYSRHSNVHAHYDQLSGLSSDTKAKMWLYHYGPNPTQKPTEDGFLGFVQKGQTFEFN